MTFRNKSIKCFNLRPLFCLSFQKNKKTAEKSRKQTDKTTMIRTVEQDEATNTSSEITNKRTT